MLFQGARSRFRLSVKQNQLPRHLLSYLGHRLRRDRVLYTWTDGPIWYRRNGPFGKWKCDRDDYIDAARSPDPFVYSIGMPSLVNLENPKWNPVLMRTEPWSGGTALADGSLDERRSEARKQTEKYGYWNKDGITLGKNNPPKTKKTKKN